MAFFVAFATLGQQPIPATMLEPGDNPAVLSAVTPSGPSLLKLEKVSLMIDQEQTIADVFMASFSQTDLAQSFIPSAGTCCGAGITLVGNIGSGSGSVTISLWTGLPNAGGTQLATGTATVTVGAENVDVNVTWPGVVVTPGLTYYLVFTSTNNFGLAGSVVNPYPYGQVYANAGYQSFPNYDYTFRTFSCTGEAVPLGNRALFIGLFLMLAFVVFRFWRLV